MINVLRALIENVVIMQEWMDSREMDILRKNQEEMLDLKNM